MGTIVQIQKRRQIEKEVVMVKSRAMRLVGRRARTVRTPITKKAMKRATIVQMMLSSKYPGVLQRGREVAEMYKSIWI